MSDYGVPTTRKVPELNTDGTGIVDVSRDTFYGLYDRDYQKTQADIGTIEIEHDLADRLPLRNATRYGATLTDYVMTNTGDGYVRSDRRGVGNAGARGGRLGW